MDACTQQRTTLQALEAPGSQQLEATKHLPVGTDAVQLVVQVLHPGVDVCIWWRLGHRLDLERSATQRKRLRCGCACMPPLLMLQHTLHVQLTEEGESALTCCSSRNKFTMLRSPAENIDSG